MIVSEKEIENVSKLEPFQRYEYFIKRVADSEKLYSLKNEENWAIAEVDQYKLFSLWPARQFAEKQIIEGWSNYQVAEIGLVNFNDEIGPMIKEKGFLLNVFSVGNQSGFVVELEEFLRDLNEELEKYQ